MDKVKKKQSNKSVKKALVNFKQESLAIIQASKTAFDAQELQERIDLFIQKLTNFKPVLDTLPSKTRQQAHFKQVAKSDFFVIRDDYFKAAEMRVSHALKSAVVTPSPKASQVERSLDASVDFIESQSDLPSRESVSSGEGSSLSDKTNTSIKDEEVLAFMRSSLLADNNGGDRKGREIEINYAAPISSLPKLPRYKSEEELIKGVMARELARYKKSANSNSAFSNHSSSNTSQLDVVLEDSQQDLSDSTSLSSESEHTLPVPPPPLSSDSSSEISEVPPPPLYADLPSSSSSDNEDHFKFDTPRSSMENSAGNEIKTLPLTKFRSQKLEFDFWEKNFKVEDSANDNAFLEELDGVKFKVLQALSEVPNTSLDEDSRAAIKSQIEVSIKNIKDTTAVHHISQQLIESFGLCMKLDLNIQNEFIELCEGIKDRSFVVSDKVFQSLDAKVSELLHLELKKKYERAQIDNVGLELMAFDEFCAFIKQKQIPCVDEVQQSLESQINRLLTKELQEKIAVAREASISPQATCEYGEVVLPAKVLMQGVNPQDVSKTTDTPAPLNQQDDSYIVLNELDESRGLTSRESTVQSGKTPFEYNVEQTTKNNLLSSLRAYKNSTRTSFYQCRDSFFGKRYRDYGLIEARLAIVNNLLGSLDNAELNNAATLQLVQLAYNQSRTLSSQYNKKSDLNGRLTQLLGDFEGLDRDADYLVGMKCNAVSSATG